MDAGYQRLCAFAIKTCWDIAEGDLASVRRISKIHFLGPFALSLSKG